MAALVFTDENVKFNGDTTKAIIMLDDDGAGNKLLITEDSLDAHDTRMFEILFDYVGVDSPATNGKQTANFGTTVVGGNATGLANDATLYTATVTVNGTPNAISFAGSTAQTFTALVGELLSDLGAGTVAGVAIVGGNIEITSALSVGVTSTVSIVDGTLFAALTGFVSFDAPINGVDAVDLMTEIEAMETLVLPNGTTYMDTYGLILKRIGDKPVWPAHDSTLVYFNGSAWVRYIDDVVVV